MTLRLVPLDLAEANALVAQLHRHHQPVVGHKASIGVADDGRVCGAAILSRPTSRMSDDGWTLEVTRLVTDGTPHSASLLYGAAKRLAVAMGYRRLVTYTLPEEGGASLRAAGWRLIGLAGGGSWSRESRPRVDRAPLQQKLRWEAQP